MDTGPAPEHGVVSPPPQPHQQVPTPSSPAQQRPSPSPQQQPQQQLTGLSPAEVVACAGDDAEGSDELDMFDMALQIEYISRSNNGNANAPPHVVASGPSSALRNTTGSAGNSSSRPAGAYQSPPSGHASTPPMMGAFNGTQLTSLAHSMEAAAGHHPANNSSGNPSDGYAPSASPTLAFLPMLNGDDELGRKIARKMVMIAQEELGGPLPGAPLPPPDGSSYTEDVRYLMGVLMHLQAKAPGATLNGCPVGGGGSSSSYAGSVRRADGGGGVHPAAAGYMTNEYMYHVGAARSGQAAAAALSLSQQQLRQQQQSPSASGSAMRSGSRTRQSPSGVVGGLRKSERDAYNNGRSTIDTEVSESLGCIGRGYPHQPSVAGFDESLRAMNPCLFPARQAPQQGYAAVGGSASTPRPSAATGTARRPQKGAGPTPGNGSGVTAVPGASSTGAHRPVAIKSAPNSGGAMGKGATGRSRGPRSESGKNIAPSNHSAFSECSGGETRSFQSTKTNLQHNTSSSAIATTNTSVSSTVYHNSSTLLTSVAGLNGSASVVGSEGVSL